MVEKPRKIDALLITHRYDDEGLFITIPEIFEKHSLALGSYDVQACNTFYKEFLLMLEEIGKLLSVNTMV